jgi:aminoglycoside N3'-acetyltransferase
MDAPLSSEELTASLRRLGVADGDVVMVHASLRAVGPVEHGAAGVVRAIDAAVGPSGTAMMTLGAREDAEPFDCQITPADPEIGVLAEIFRRTPGTVVSDHPEGRVGARGRLAAALMSEVPWHDYYGPGSPLQRLVEARGRVLRLGAGRDTVTLIHYAEYLAEVPDKRRVERHPRVRGAHGAEVRTVHCLDDSHGIVDYPGEDYFAQILDAFLDATDSPRGLIGQARSELLDAATLVEFAARWMTDRFRAGRVTSMARGGGPRARP